MATKSITHSAVVLNIFRDTVTVSVESSEACGGCASKSACSLGVQSNTRNILITTPDASQYSVGERVVVATRAQMGLIAVVLSYGVPAVVLVATVVISQLLGVNEGISALLGLAAVALNYFILWLFKGKLAQKISFTIHKEK